VIRYAASKISIKHYKLKIYLNFMQTFKIDEKEYSLSDLLSRKSEKLVRFETIEFLDNIWETVSDNDKSLLNQEQGLIEKILVP